MPRVGLLGFPIGHSFSKSYFEEKFKRLQLSTFEFKLFEFVSIEAFEAVVKNESSLIGFSVTSPHKVNIIRLLTEIHPEAEAVGAVNCVKVVRHGNNLGFKGYNTDVHGFRQSIKPFLEPHHYRALIIGTGGAARAVEFALKQIGIEVYFLTRNKNRFAGKEKYLEFDQINPEMLQHFKLIINTSPAEMLSAGENYPPLPYQTISHQHFCYDLIYQPAETKFLKKCKAQGALVMNGLDMLYAQAEKSWEIWNTQITS